MTSLRFPASEYYRDSAVTIWHGNAMALPVADSSVDLIVTSPPYFAQRSYKDDGQHMSAQMGGEATPTEFLDALIAATREMVRVLKPSGSIFVNLGDKYAQATERSRNGHSGNLVGTNPLRTGPEYTGGRDNGVPMKSLMLIPERYRIRCVDELGLIVRAVVVWSKPNGLPESVTDRVRRSHEDWAHLTKAPRYYCAIDEMAANPLGKLPGSVWSIATQPLKVPAELGIDHFAAFPMEWPRRLILGWSPPGICTMCGEGLIPVTEVSHTGTRRDRSASWVVGSAQYRTGSTEQGGTRSIGAVTKITGYACRCRGQAKDVRPAVVLDPFGGTGTTGVVAKVLGRKAILVDLSRDYCRLAEWRINDPKQLARAERGNRAKT